MMAYQLGEWDLVLSLTSTDGEQPPSLAEAGLTAVALAVHAGRGQSDGWLQRMARVRSEWATDGMIAVHSTAAAIDLYGNAGEVDQALAVYAEMLECIRRVWGGTDFQAQIRLVSLLLGQLASSAAGMSSERRAQLLAYADELVAVAENAYGMGRRRERGLESQAWLARLRAELLRFRRAAGEAVDPAVLTAAWELAVEAFTRYGEPFEQARSRARLAAALRLAGDNTSSSAQARAAEETALQLHAAPLLAELRPLTGTRPAHASVDLLTPREHEVLTLVAAGHSNREIGERLYVSAKTASVHVSNIMAKLDVRSRTEAAAVARRRGLID
jgi:pentatricopeptide repeat protein